MSLEYAFTQALAEQPAARLGRRVKRALRHVHACPEAKLTYLPSHEVKRLGYRWHQLGKRWASLRLGGCSWVGPIERLRADWWDLLEQSANADCPSARLPPDDGAELLRQFARGVGLVDDAIGTRERSYILRLAGSLPTDQADLCRVPGARLFSPFTILGAALDDLNQHDLAQRRAFRDRIEGAPTQDGHASYASRLHAFCLQGAEWLL